MFVFYSYVFYLRNEVLGTLQPQCGLIVKSLELWKHRSQIWTEVGDTTAPCVSSGFQKNERVSTPESERTSTRMYEECTLIHGDLPTRW